eukprot:scaffold35708_cov129-Isochrysis_galbana.AAC.4
MPPDVRACTSWLPSRSGPRGDERARSHRRMDPSLEEVSSLAPPVSPREQRLERLGKLLAPPEACQGPDDCPAGVTGCGQQRWSLCGRSAGQESSSAVRRHPTSRPSAASVARHSSIPSAADRAQPADASTPAVQKYRSTLEWSKAGPSSSAASSTSAAQAAASAPASDGSGFARLRNTRLLRGGGGGAGAVCLRALDGGLNFVGRTGSARPSAASAAWFSAMLRSRSSSYSLSPAHGVDVGAPPRQRAVSREICGAASSTAARASV